MVSRRSVLGALGAGLTVSTAGCISSLSQLAGPTHNENGLTFTEEVYRGQTSYRYEFNLAEGEYDYDVLEIPGDIPIRLSMDVSSGSAHGMMLREREFEQNYQDGNLQGYFAIGDEDDGWVHANGTGAGSSMWYMVVDNTDYLDHTPQGHAEGRYSITTE